jgi:hypothetical protein
MLTEDTIIRMINLAIAALLRIMGLRKNGAYEEALQWIDLTFEQLLGLRASMVKNLDDERLYFLLTRNEELDTRRLELVADLFWEEAAIYALQNRGAESQARVTRALKYYLDVLLEGTAENPPGVKGKIEDALRLVDVERLAPAVLWPLAGYYEESGAYDRAERVLLVLAERPDTREAIHPELLSFYERMLELPAETLARGGLTAAGVKTALAQRKNL